MAKHGARINTKYIIPSKRKLDGKAIKCPVCNKVLASWNKSGICHMHKSMEDTLNSQAQKLY